MYDEKDLAAVEARTLKLMREHGHEPSIGLPTRPDAPNWQHGEEFHTIQCRACLKLAAVNISTLEISGEVTQTTCTNGPGLNRLNLRKQMKNKSLAP